ncbi:MAG: helix-turn-helix domain-containing protein [Acidobacteriia bacterium]|nr:helix-turn-helix domain-containing protein [Terriglobia bacterium]
MKRQERLDLEPLLLRGGEVAELLGCSRALAYRWMSAGVVPTVHVPGSRSIRVPRAALLEWIAQRTQQPRGGAAA